MRAHAAPHAAPGAAGPQGVPQAVRQALAAPGRPLDAATRGRMERRFGQDFTGVRIHAGAGAAASARAVGAAAYTVGRHVVFGRDGFVPGRARHEALLAHEMAHVVQQRGAAPGPVLRVDRADSRQEREAASPGAALTPLAAQRLQRAPEEEAASSFAGAAADAVGGAVFGKRIWPFVEAMLEGFAGGLSADVKAGRGAEAKAHLAGLLSPWNAAKFYGGYIVGFAIGLVSPVTDLVKGIVGAVRLAASAAEWLAKWSAIGIAVSAERQAKVTRLVASLQDLDGEWGKALERLLKDPVGAVKGISGLIDEMMDAGVERARGLGAEAAHSVFDVLKREFYDLGKAIGEVVGMLLAQVLLLVFSQAIGNLVSKGGAMLGKAAEFVAGKAAEVIGWVKGFAAEIVGLIRGAMRGALRMFEGLGAKAARVFEDLSALFSDAAAALAAEGRVAAGVGRVETGAQAAGKGFAESRMVEAGRTTQTTVEGLRTPKVHPSNVGKPPPAKPRRTPKAQPTEAEEMLAEARATLSPEEFREFERTMERGEAILEEQGKFQHSARGATKEEAAVAPGQREARTPGKSQPVRFERGTFAHDNAELLIKRSELPAGLRAEVTVELPGGRVRLDRVDFTEGVYYEIKPARAASPEYTAASVAKGEEQLRKYAEYMNRNFPLRGGRKWVGKVVTYEMEEAIALFGM